MRLLPTEAKAKIEEAVRAWEGLRRGVMYLYEPCNCGWTIRHFNGGNYHEIVRLWRKGGRVFVMFDSTCELVPPPDWQEITEEKARSIIIDRVSDGYYWEVKDR